jgi:hypothetical protein
MNIFVKCLIGCLAVMLLSVFLICFETLAFLFPFFLTLAITSGIGIWVFFCLAMFKRGGCIK